MFSLLNFMSVALKRRNTATFPDQPQTEEYLNTLSPRTVRDFRKFFAEKASECTLYSGVLAARVFVLSIEWENVSLEPSQFRDRVSKLSEPGIIDLFEQLPKESQQALWKHDFALNGFSSNCTTEAYFSLLIRTGLPARFCSSLIEKYHILNNDGLSKPLSRLNMFFCIPEEKRWVSYVPNNLDIPEPSKQFRNVLVDAFQDEYIVMTRIDNSYKYPKTTINFGTKATEGSVMLSVLYGEQLVIELFTYATESRVKMCLHDAVSLLNSWTKYPAYPIDWIVQMTEDQHNHLSWEDQTWMLR